MREAGEGFQYAPTAEILLWVFLLRSGWIALLLLLLLHLLLLQKLALLHLLHDLLRSAHRSGWRGTGLTLVRHLRSRLNGGRLFLWLLRLLRLICAIVVRVWLHLLLRAQPALAARISGAPRGQDDLAGGTLAQIAGEKDVEAGTL